MERESGLSGKSYPRLMKKNVTRNMRPKNRQGIEGRGPKSYVPHAMRATDILFFPQDKAGNVQVTLYLRCWIWKVDIVEACGRFNLP